VLTKYEENHIKKIEHIKYKMVACQIESVEPEHFCNLPPFNLPPFYSMPEML